MSLNQLYLISQNIRADLKRPKININCTMVDIQGGGGCILRPPHLTAVAAVKAKQKPKKK